jgi:hypothetical protein
VAGEELARTAADLHLVASKQVLAIQGLFESRSVTIGQFNHFTSVIGTPLDSRLAYAPLVLGEQVDEFLDQARVAQPGFSILGRDDDPANEYWPLLYSTADDGEGYGPGFDFGSDPDIQAAIQRGILTGHPVASRFVVVPGGNEIGDFVVISVIRRNSKPEGIAVATVRLDEHLEPLLHELLGNIATLHLDNLLYAGEAPDQQTATLDRDRESGRATSRAAG